MTIQPIRDQILFRLLKTPDEVVQGGLVIPGAKTDYNRATVEALGSGMRDERGNLVPFDVKVGDTVLLMKYGPVEIKIDGVAYLIGGQEHVLGVEEVNE